MRDGEGSGGAVVECRSISAGNFSERKDRRVSKDGVAGVVRVGGRVEGAFVAGRECVLIVEVSDLAVVDLVAVAADIPSFVVALLHEGFEAVEESVGDALRGGGAGELVV